MAEMNVGLGLNLVLLGKTGAGKSSSGNTILGRKAFISRKSSRSVTLDVAVESGTVDGITVNVYDTPGLFDTELSDDEIQQKYEVLLQRCGSVCCVFLLVIKADRFTEEERETVAKIEELLGEDRLEKTWILFTSGDQLEEENITIQEFINDNQHLKNIVQNYDQRYHVFNNKRRGHTGQVKMLITKILKARLHTMGKGATKLDQSSLKRQKPKATLAVSLSSRRIVLLGKTGVGKSAAGNTILRQKEFISLMRTKSVTSESSVKHATVSDRSVSVVDTPGLFDTQMKTEELVMEIARSVYISSPGPHAFLIVFRVDDRFTDQEQQIPQKIEMMFGEEVLKYSIILFTHGDLLRGKPIEKLIEENCRLRDLVDQCGGRFHVFNNRDMNNRDQVNELLQKIDTMIEQNGGGHYSNQMYEDAKRLRREERRQRLEEEIRQILEEEMRPRLEEEMRQRLEEEMRQILEEEMRQRLEEEMRQILEERRQRSEERRQRSEERRQRSEERRQRLEERKIRQEQNGNGKSKSFWVKVGAITGAVIAAPFVAAVVALPVATAAAAVAVGAAAGGVAAAIVGVAAGAAVGGAVGELNANRKEKERKQQDKKK